MKTNDDSFFASEIDPRVEARELTLEVLRRLALWMADATTLEDRGLRMTVYLYCVRPDLLSETTLEEVGERTGRTRQWVHQLVESFRNFTGFTV